MKTSVEHEARASARRSAAWKRPIALAVYVVGGLWSLAALQAGLAALIARDWGMIPAWSIIAISGWWITAGTGIWFGVVPREFLHVLRDALGFAREPSRRDGD